MEALEIDTGGRTIELVETLGVGACGCVSVSACTLES